MEALFTLISIGLTIILLVSLFSKLNRITRNQERAFFYQHQQFVKNGGGTNLSVYPSWYLIELQKAEVLSKRQVKEELAKRKDEKQTSRVEVLD